MHTTSLAKILLSLPLAFAIPSTHADSLHDLQQALKKFEQNTPFSAQVIASVKNQSTEGDDKNVKKGFAQFKVEQNPAGLQIRYSPELLSNIDKEAETKKQNPQAPTPATEAMNRFNYSEISILLNPVRDIEDDLRKAQLLKEESVSYKGKPARLLHLQIPLEKLSEEERKNLKKYRTDLQIWIDENGTPLASRSIGKGSGRFALVVGFEFHFDVEKTYITQSNRLLVTELSSTSGSSGASMDTNETITASLTLLN